MHNETRCEAGVGRLQRDGGVRKYSDAQQVWRDLADRALQLNFTDSESSVVGDLLVEAMEKLVQEPPASQRESLRHCFRSFDSLEDFMGNFECECDAWL